jgi:hypothetical protein
MAVRDKLGDVLSVGPLPVFPLGSDTFYFWIAELSTLMVSKNEIWRLRSPELRGNLSPL